MSRAGSGSADGSRAARLAICPATPDDLPEIVRVYLAAYAQPPWCERNDPTHSRMYLERLVRGVLRLGKRVHSRMYLKRLLGIPDSQCLIVTDAAAGNGADRVYGLVMGAPRTPAEFYKDWERICYPLPQGWPRLPTATNAIGYIYELAVDPPWQGHGLGGRLLDAVLQALTELGAELIALRSSERAAVAVGLYEQRGFTRWPLRERRQPDARWWQRRTPSLARD